MSKIEFLATQERRPPKRPRGRPRVRGIKPFAHYAGSLKGERPRCKAPGCVTFLSRDQHAVCSDDCARALRDWLMTLGELLEKDDARANAEAMARAVAERDR